MPSRRKRGAMTLEEHDALLKEEGRYDAMLEAQGAREAESHRLSEEWRAAETPLAEQLREAGFDVESAWDLVNTSTPYPDALPILLEHLDRPYPDRVREGIARALAVRDARFGWETLARLYREEDEGTDAKDGLAVALAAASDDDVAGELIALARDADHGSSRVLLLAGLARSETSQAREALEQLGGDPDLGKEARALLG